MTALGGARSQALDVLRAVAVLLVIAAHTKGPGRNEPDAVRFVWGVWQKGGWSGVDLFFALSGFLVAGLLFAEYRHDGTLRVGRFLVRRGFRIYPAFWLYVAFMVAASIARGRAVPLERVAAELLFVQNYWKGIWWGHTWSLAVEEHFYVLLPLVLVLLARRAPGIADPFRPLVFLWLLVAVTCLALRLDGAGVGRFSGRSDIYPTHLRIDSLTFGAVLAYAWHFHRARLAPFLERWGLVVALLGVAIVLPVFTTSIRRPWVHSFGFTLLAVGYGAVVLAAVAAWRPRARAWRVLALIGQHSYSIYLWHRVVTVLGRDALQAALGHRPPFLVEMALTTLGAVALGVILSKLVEGPALRLRERWFPVSATPSAR